MAQKKQRKKLWVQIISPPLFGEHMIGETNVYETEKAIGKVMTLNLMVLTSDPKHQNISITLKIDRVSGDRAHTMPIKYKLLASSLKRLVRRKRDRLDLSFAVKTKDGCTIRVKPMVITRNNARGSVLTTLRNLTLKYYMTEIPKLTYYAFFSQVLHRKIQLGLKDRLKKTYPVNISDVRHLELISGTPEAMKTEEPRRPEAKPVKKEEPKEAKKPEKAEEKPKEEPKAHKKAEKPEEEPKKEEPKPDKKVNKKVKKEEK